MARIFSWYIKDEKKQLECFSYLAQSGSSGTYGRGYMVLDNKIESSETLKKIADVVSRYTESDYQAQFNNMKTKVTEKGLNPDWKDYTYYYDVNGNNLIMLTGNGEIGPQGPQGIQGEKGETGSAGNGRNVMCYCGLDEGIIPTRANVTGGKFYPNKWEIEFPTDPKGKCMWQDSNEFGSGKVVWMTNADFPSSTGDSPSEAVTPVVKIDSHGQEYTWATPIQISGPKGDNGADGERIEFVYKRCHKRTDPVPDRPTGTTEEQAKKQGWEDHPLGVIGDSDNPNENWRVEYMCQHIKDEEGNWGEFSDPILWASWGEDGNDGDGIEYIFAVTKDYSAPGNLPKSTDAALSGHWQDPEIWDYIREHGLDTRYAPWTDDPKDVSADEPYEWVSIRRRKWNASQDKGVFGEFGTPKLWAHWGKDGEKGNDGTSVDIRGQADTLGKLLKSLGNKVPEVGFSYAIGTDGKRVYVWMEQDSSYQIGRSIYNPPMSASTWYDKSDDDIYNNWYYLKDNKKYWFTDCGSFYGEPGKNAYVHIKYATDYTGQTGVNHVVTEIKGVNGKRDICFTTGGTTLGETPGPYIATYSDDIYDDRGDLPFYNGKWAKFEGEDGQSYGQEQIFFRSSTLLDTRLFSKKATTTEHGYDAGEWYLDIDYVGSFDKVDWVPKNWTDVPMGIVNGVYNFEYVSVRRLLEDGTWSYFSEPALYNEAGDTTEFQVEYSTWSGETTPVLANASEYTDENGNFDEPGWRAAHASTGPWTDSNTTSTVWMATAQKIKKNSNSATTIWSDWQITRCKGINGKAGNGRNVMCYCSLPEGYKPTRANLAGGKFYPNKWDITYPTDPVGIIVEGVKKYCSWGDSNEPVDPTYKVWMTNADFPNSTGTSKDEFVEPIVKTDTQKQEYTWSTPVCITGEKGDNGADGDAIEFIYFRTADNTIVPDRPGGMSDPDYQKSDFTPEAYIGGEDTGEKWKDHPLGIEKGFRCEWMSQRTKDSATGLWGAFSDVAPWSRWGEDGMDGDGIEYIFAVTKDLSQESLNAIKSVLPSTTSNGGELAQYWQEPEIWDTIEASPTFKAHYSKITSVFSGWTDDPTDVSPEEPYEWVSIRRKQYEASVGDAVFHEFEEPTLWARWSDDGDSILTSFSFATLSAGTDISGCKVSGFTVTNDSINPKWTKRGGTILSGITWEDAPHQEDSSQIIWMVSGVFKKHVNAKTGAVTIDQTQAWSPIQQMVDTADFEAIYTANEAPKNPNTIPNFRKDGVGIDPTWLAAANQIGWYDEVYEVPGGKAIWMATIKGHSNIWDKDANSKDNWQIMKVKGEKGDSGSTGVSKFKSIVFKRATTKPDKPFDSAGSYASPVPSGWYDTIPSGTGEVWTTSRTFASDGSNDAHWSDVISCIDTEYVDYEWTRHWATIEDADSHKPLKSAPDQSLTPAQNNQWYDSPISGATFMAVRQVDNGVYKGNWEVSQIKGEKGDPGIDGVSKFKSIVFKRTNTKPSAPTIGSYTEPVPKAEGWSDTIPTGDTILWMSSRTFSSDGNNDPSWSEPSQATDNEYIDYEWNKYYTTVEEGKAHLPLKDSPKASHASPDSNHWYDSPIEGAVLMAVRQVRNGEYVPGEDWQITKIKGEDGASPTDLEYLKNIFPNVDASADTATLRGFLGVMSGNSDNSDVVAFLNGSSGITDQDHGTLMIAAGVDSLNQANLAKFRVYEDGTVCAKDAEIDGSVTASTGYIGGIEIGNGGIGTTGDDGNGFRLSSDGSVTINNKNVQINNNGITYLSNDGEPVLTVQNFSYTSLTQFVNTMSGETIEVVKGYTKPIDYKTTQTYVYAGAPQTIEYSIDYTEPVALATFTIPAGSKQRVVISPGGIHINGDILNYETEQVYIHNYSCNLGYIMPIMLVHPNGEEDVLDRVYGNIGQGYSDNPRGVSYTYTRILSEGTYTLQIGSSLDWGEQYHQAGRVGVYVNKDDYGPGLCQYNAFVTFGDLRISGNPVNSGTEIFRNGIGIKNSTKNYFFIATPDGSNPANLIMSVRSNGKGFDLIDGKWTNHDIKP